MSTENVWSCLACTMENPPLYLSCGVCQTLKPLTSSSLDSSTAPQSLTSNDQLMEYRMKQQQRYQQQQKTDTESSSVSSALPSQSFLSSSQTIQYSQHRIASTSISLLAKLINRSALKKGIFSAMVYRLPWLRTFLPSSAEIVYIFDKKFEPLAPLLENESKIIPPKPERGCMHSKIMVLFFDSYIRVVITSANLVDYDYDGSLDNIIWYQDFPKGVAADNNFKISFLQALNGLTVPVDILKELDGYDYSLATGEIVTSQPVSTSSLRPDIFNFQGFPSLARIQKGMIGTKDFGIESLKSSLYMTSSLGALSEDFINSFMSAACGKVYNPKSQTNIAPKTPFKLLYPTQQLVRNSRLGEGGAGTITFNQSYYNKPSFPRQVLRQCTMKVPNSLSHTKLFFVEFDNNEADIYGTCYIGSHNFTAAAWGKITAPKTLNKINMVIKNYELGVVIGLESKQDFDDLWRPFSSVEPYTRNDVPWFNSSF